MGPGEDNGEAHRGRHGSCRDPRVHGLGEETQHSSATRSELAMREFRPQMWGLFCDLDMCPHFPPRELAVLRWGSFFPA